MSNSISGIQLDVEFDTEIDVELSSLQALQSIKSNVSNGASDKFPPNFFDISRFFDIFLAFSDVLGSFRTRLDVCRRVRMRSDAVGRIWTFSEICGFCRIKFNFCIIFERFRTNSDVFGGFRTCLDTFGCVRIGSEVFQYIRIHSDWDFFDRMLQNAILMQSFWWNLLRTS